MKKLERKYYYTFYSCLTILLIPVIMGLVIFNDFFAYFLCLAMFAPFGVLGAILTRLLILKGFVRGELYNATFAATTAVAVFLAGFFWLPLGEFFIKNIPDATNFLPFHVFILTVLLLGACAIALSFAKTRKSAYLSVSGIVLLFCTGVLLPGGVALCAPDPVCNILPFYAMMLAFNFVTLFCPIFFTVLTFGALVKLIARFIFSQPLPSFVKVLTK